MTFTPTDINPYQSIALRRMLDRGMAIEDVAQITGLTEAEIQQRYQGTFLRMFKDLMLRILSFPF
jgi:hypothetical protein